MQRIPEYSCVRKDAVYIDIFVTPRNGDRKIMQSIQYIIMNRPPSRSYQSGASYQSNTYRKDLS